MWLLRFPRSWITAISVNDPPRLRFSYFGLCLSRGIARHLFRPAGFDLHSVVLEFEVSVWCTNDGMVNWLVVYCLWWTYIYWPVVVIKSLMLNIFVFLGGVGTWTFGWRVNLTFCISSGLLSYSEDWMSMFGLERNLFIIVVCNGTYSS